MKRPKIPKNLLRHGRQFAGEVLDYIDQTKPLAGPGVQFNEMPDGMQAVAESGVGTRVDFWVNGILTSRVI